MKKCKQVLSLLLVFVMLAVAVPLNGTYVNVYAAGTVTGQAIVDYAKRFLGCPYGSSYGPDVFDCCGLVLYVYAHFGITLPWSCWDYQSYGTVISSNEAKPGDLVVWHGKHVGICSGNGMMINALNGKYGVCTVAISAMSSGSPSYYIRINGVDNNHTQHDYQFQYYQEAHPHYGFYRCSCGASYNNTSVTRKDPTCSICNPNEPYRIENGVFPTGTIGYGEDFQIEGTLYSTASIKWVKGNILDANKTILQSNSGKWPYTNSYDLSDLNDQLDFSALQSGNYYFMLQAQAGDYSDMDVVWRPFTVPEPFTTTDICLPQGYLLKGNTFSISGTIECLLNISWVNCDIVDLSNNTVVCQTPSINPDAKTFDISALNSGFSTSSLAPGDYRFVLKAGAWKDGWVNMNNIYSVFSVVESYKLSFDANGGENPPSDLTGSSKYIIPDSQCSREGFILEGWSYWNDPSLVFHPGDELELTRDTCLVAVWKEHTHTLVLQNKINATCTTAGYTGDQYCTTCKQTISRGSTVNALGHTAPDANGNCTRCGTHLQDVTETQQDGGCPWCGGTHNGFIGAIVGFFHRILAAIFGARY